MLSKHVSKNKARKAIKEIFPPSMYTTYGLKPKWNFATKWNSGSKEKSHSSKRRNLPPLPNKTASKPPTLKVNDYWNSTASTNYWSNLNSKEKPQVVTSSDKE